MVIGALELFPHLNPILLASPLNWIVCLIPALYALQFRSTVIYMESQVENSTDEKYKTQGASVPASITVYKASTGEGGNDYVE